MVNYRSKFHSQKVTVNGETFDSIKEYNRFCELSLMERSGIITDLKRQEKFLLIPSQKIDEKVVERPVTYIADFVYVKDRKVIVEDTKGFKTPEYILKRKMMLWIHGIRINEV